MDNTQSLFLTPNNANVFNKADEIIAVAGSSPSLFSRYKTIIFFSIGILVFLIILIVVYMYFNKSSTPSKTEKEDTATSPHSQPSHSMANQEFFNGLVSNMNTMHRAINDLKKDVDTVTSRINAQEEVNNELAQQSKTKT